MTSFPTWCFAILLLIVTVTVSQAVQWSPSPPDETIVQTCVGQDVMFPWRFTLEPGETLEDIKWHYTDDKSSQLIAMSGSTFLVKPPFSGRLRRLGIGGIVMSHVVAKDGGNYSVHLTVRHKKPASVTISKRTITLLVATAPLIRDSGTLTVSQSRTAVYNNLTDTWHVQLTCGTFTDLGQPPVDVVWKTPSGSALPSTDYEDGQFHLLLTNPPLGGDYTCTVSPDSPASSCFHGNDPRPREAAVTVDEVKVRLTLLEAHQGSHQGNKLVELKAEVKQQKAELQQQRTDLQRQKSELHLQKTELQQQITDLEQQKAETLHLRKKNAYLTNQLRNLTNYVHRFQNQLNARHGNASGSVSFQARLIADETVSYPNPVILGSVHTNEGGAYSASTGVFTVPVSGVYVLFAEVGTATNNQYAGGYLMVDDDWVCFTYCTHSSGIQSSSCQAVTYLVKGQRVWLRADDSSHYWSSTTTLGGVLVVAYEKSFQ